MSRKLTFDPVLGKGFEAIFHRITKDMEFDAEPPLGYASWEQFILDALAQRLRNESDPVRNIVGYSMALIQAVKRAPQIDPSIAYPALVRRLIDAGLLPETHHG